MQRHWNHQSARRGSSPPARRIHPPSARARWVRSPCFNDSTRPRLCCRSGITARARSQLTRSRAQAAHTAPSPIGYGNGRPQTTHQGGAKKLIVAQHGPHSASGLVDHRAAGERQTRRQDAVDQGSSSPATKPGEKLARRNGRAGLLEVRDARPSSIRGGAVSHPVLRRSEFPASDGVLSDLPANAAASFDRRAWRAT